MIEHVAMMNLHNEDPLKVEALIEILNSLGSLPGVSVLFLTTTPILRHSGFPNNLHFTHSLHARYASLSDLHSYNANPAHVRIHAELMALPVLSDLIVLDLAWPTLRPKLLLPGQAVRLTCFKLKEGANEKKREILEGLSKIEGTFEEMTYGEEISIERAKGFTVAAVAIFADLNALEACEEYEGAMRSLVDQHDDAIDSVISIDYVIPHSGPTDTINVQG